MTKEQIKGFYVYNFST